MSLPSRNPLAGRLWLLAACLALLAVGSVQAQDGDDETEDAQSAEEEPDQAALEAEADHADHHGEPTPEELRALRQEIAAFEAEEQAAMRAAREAAEAEARATTRGRLRAATSRSIGTANRGFLRNAAALESSETIHIKGSSRTNRYGTAELVELIEQAAAAVARAHPGSRLAVGDLSQRGGGRLRPHRSHRTGRDADLGFYMLDSDNHAIPDAGVFVRMNNDGFGVRRGRTYAFDVARNWIFVEALVTHPDIHTQYIFVARPLIEKLLRHAARIGAPAESIQRARRVLHQPSRGAPHRGHFHLRIYCPPDDRPSCVDDPPFHPWVRSGARATDQHEADSDMRAVPVALP